MPFHIHAGQLFLTYPRCELDKQQAYDQLEALLYGFNPDLSIVDYIIARELHANGEHHLHVYLKLAVPLQTKREHLLDLRNGDLIHHGNYQGCRSSKNVIKYVTKAEDYISNLDIAALVNTKSNRSRIAQKLVNEKRSLEELLVDHPELIFGYSRLKQDILTYKADIEETPTLPNSIDTPWSFSIDTTCVDKLRHYWIYSAEPNKGKTTFGLELRRKYGGYIATGDLTYWNVTQRTPFIIFDEYNRARFAGDTLNSIADGTFKFRLFGRGVVELDKYIVLIFSNVSIDVLYNELFSKLLRTRFIEVNVDNSNQFDICLNLQH